MLSYDVTEEAKEDLFRIYEYGIGQFGLAQADKYFEMLHECFRKIASNPFMFPKDFNHSGIDRYCVCGVDTIYFNVKGDNVEIITIVGRQHF